LRDRTARFPIATGASAGSEAKRFLTALLHFISNEDLEIIPLEVEANSVFPDLLAKESLLPTESPRSEIRSDRACHA
jgi:hypothetical protein